MHGSTPKTGIANRPDSLLNWNLAAQQSSRTSSLVMQKRKRRSELLASALQKIVQTAASVVRTGFCPNPFRVQRLIQVGIEEKANAIGVGSTNIRGCDGWSPLRGHKLCRCGCMQKPSFSFSFVDPDVVDEILLRESVRSRSRLDRRGYGGVD